MTKNYNSTETLYLSVTQQNLADFKQAVTAIAEAGKPCTQYENILTTLLAHANATVYDLEKNHAARIQFVRDAIAFVSGVRLVGQQDIDWVKVTEKINSEFQYKPGDVLGRLSGIKALLDHYPELNPAMLVDEDGVTPLMSIMSSIYENHDFLKELIHLGFDVNQRSNKNGSAIHFLSVDNHAAMENVALLIVAGVNPLENVPFTRFGAWVTTGRSRPYESFYDFVKENGYTHLVEMCDKFNASKQAMGIAEHQLTRRQSRASL